MATSKTGAGSGRCGRFLPALCRTNDLSIPSLGRGRTRLTLRQHFPSKEALEGALASDMEAGMRVTFDQLDQLVVSTR
jgi:hypothetical protein